MRDEDAVAELPVLVPEKPQDNDKLVPWAVQWRSKLSKNWPQSARNWAVKWCIAHQAVFRTKTVRSWEQDLRTAMNVELLRDCTRPSRLLGPSGKWVKDHLALRNRQANEKSLGQNDIDYPQAMDDWIGLMSRSQPDLLKHLGTQRTDLRTLGDIVRDDMMARMSHHTLSTSTSTDEEEEYEDEDEEDDDGEVEGEGEENDTVESIPFRDQPTSADKRESALLPYATSRMNTKTLRQAATQLKRSRDAPSMAENPMRGDKRHQCVDIRNQDRHPIAELSSTLRSTLGDFGKTLSGALISAAKTTADANTAVAATDTVAQTRLLNARMERLEQEIKEMRSANDKFMKDVLQEVKSANNKLMVVLQQLLEHGGNRIESVE